MSKKDKSINVKLIANPGAGNDSESVNNLKLVVASLEKNGLKVDVMADGVALGKGTVTIKVRPGTLRVITTGKSPVLENPKIDTNATLSMPVASLTVGKNHEKESINAAG
jgi:hypothetical protein